MSSHINKPGYDLTQPHQRHVNRLYALDWLCAGFKRLSSRKQQRLALAKLDDRLLADVGLTREQARAKSSKSTWQR